MVYYVGGTLVGDPMGCRLFFCPLARGELNVVSRARFFDGGFASKDLDGCQRGVIFFGNVLIALLPLLIHRLYQRVNLRRGLPRDRCEITIWSFADQAFGFGVVE